MGKRIGVGVAALLIALAFVFPHATLAAARAVGYSVCHQWPEHSFAVGGAAFPLCARCTGTYFGALAVLAFAWATGRAKAGAWPPRVVAILLAAGLALMVLDGGNSLADQLTGGRMRLYPPANALRYATGVFSGMAMVGFGYPLLNAVLWRDWADSPILRRGREVIGLAVAVWAGLPIVSGVGWLLPLVSLLSLAGMALMFTGINMALWVVLARREERASVFRDVLPALAAGSLLASGELLLIRVARATLERAAVGSP
ncbi:MAG: DUF2085 domain-containing protein [Chloroflexi bacterium]|nr:DUF2085 domain-containing protein [Chloroflexota bacterium]